ncbi:uncharacterized protein LAESUDRAFT_749866 [Laetiporus sulphureus 93-53]|uniref:C2H2-type domain-containing protein n=1 Tax=Laetiporus sulphureus 93-53 TaxID=1314785 RepID=A0A165EB33_9APHY|nr:uncharacterized protein LAESUDRAFT_749866 [Laetiporus sulphureus 93-53]KZT06636.1 hypothetical protein LAESUDRAFT_749866 [Laetiporus sulphureus 93-53]
MNMVAAQSLNYLSSILRKEIECLITKVHEFANGTPHLPSPNDPSLADCVLTIYIVPEEIPEPNERYSVMRVVQEPVCVTLLNFATRRDVWTRRLSMATAHSVLATHASTLTAQPCQRPQQSTTELRRQGEMSSSSSSSTHSVPAIPDSKEVLPSPSQSQELAATMLIASDAGDTTEPIAPPKTILDSGGECATSSLQMPRRRVARRHSARPSGSTSSQTSADATPVVPTILFPSACMPPLPYTLDDILYFQEVLPPEEFQELGAGVIDWQDHSKLPEGEDSSERDRHWDFLDPEGIHDFETSLLKDRQSRRRDLSEGYRVASVSKSTAYRDAEAHWSGPSITNIIEQQAPPLLWNMRETDDHDLNDSENRAPQDAIAGRSMKSHQSMSQSAMVPQGHALLNKASGSPSIPPATMNTPATSQPKACKDKSLSVRTLADREPLVAASLNAVGNVSTTATMRHIRSRRSPAPALVKEPASRAHSPTMSSPTASGSDDSELKISDHLRVATADSVVCQWRHATPGLLPCTHSCSPLDMWVHIRTAHVLGDSCRWDECDRTRGFSNLKRHVERNHLCIKWRCPSVGCNLSFSRVDSLARHLKTKHDCVSGNAVEEDDEIELARSGLKGSQEARRPQRASKAARKRPADENLDQSSRKKPYKHVRSQ